MIQCKCNLVGKLSAKENLTGKLNNAIVKEYPELEDLEVTPSSSEQSFKSSKYGYDNVKVKAIETTELNIMPSTENQVKEGTFSKVTVAGDSNLVAENIPIGKTIFGIPGTAEVKGEENATLFTQPSTGNKINYLIQKIPTINFSGLTNVANFFDGCLNLEEVSLVNTSRLNIINYLFYNCQKLTKIIFPEKPNISQMISAFYNCRKLESVENINTSNCNFFSETFSGCNSLKECPDINTNNATNVYGMFKSCMNLITIPKLYFGKVIRIDYLLNNCSSLQNLGGFEEIGKAFTTKTVNNSFYILDLSYSPLLTHDSLMNVINNLYDLNLTYNVANGGTLYRQKLNLGATNKAKLTAEEIQIATDKGWNVT